MDSHLVQVAQIFKDEFRWLLEEKYDWSRASVHQYLSEIEKGSSRVLAAEIYQDLEQLAAGVPIAYLIGHVDFLGSSIDLSRKPLIPRLETEYWIEQCLRSLAWQGQGRGKQVLDLCSGSGCLSVVTLKWYPGVELVASDIDSQAVAQTQFNIQNLEKREKKQFQAQVVTSNLFSQLPGAFDLILCNPPYVDPTTNILPELQSEPPQALFAQKNGFELIERIILEIKKHLRFADSQLWIEFQYDQAARLQALCDKEKLSCQVHQDQFGHDRFAIISTKLALHLQN